MNLRMISAAVPLLKDSAGHFSLQQDEISHCMLVICDLNGVTGLDCDIIKLQEYSYIFIERYELTADHTRQEKYSKAIFHTLYEALKDSYVVEVLENVT